MSFGPAGAAGGAEQVSIAGAHVGFAPVGVANSALAPVVSGATATYAGLWPGTNVSERVTASQVKEDIELENAAAPSSFSFRLTGATARPDAAGGLAVLAGARQVGVIAPLRVTMRLPRQLEPGVSRGTGADVTTASGAELTVADNVVRVSVSRSWLSRLPASAFPVVIDPSFAALAGPSAFVSVDDAGDVLTNQVMQVGVDSRFRTWRTAVYFAAPGVPPQITEPGDPEPWVLSSATMVANCTPACGQLQNVSLYGLGTSAPPSYPSFGAFSPSLGQLLWASPPGLPVSAVGSDTTEAGNAILLQYMHSRTDGWWFGIAGDDTPSIVDFNLANTSIAFVYVQQPPPTYVTAPTGVIATTTPTLTAAPVTDTTDTPSYDFRISTSASGLGTIVDSGWLKNQSSWTVPPGSLQDGSTYYDTVSVAITQQSDTTDPSYVPPAVPWRSSSFIVREHLGGGGPSPTDTIGSPPGSTSTPSQGVPSPGAPTASETVNMITGNLSLAVTTPGMQALGGTAGVTLTYNSASSSLARGSDYGLTGQYYADDGTHTFDSPLAGQRTDPVIDQSWGSSPPVSGLNQWQAFISRWTGAISLPAGTWELGGLTTGGMRIFLNGSATPSYDDWAGTAATSGPSYGTATVTGPAQFQIEVDDWDANQTGNTTVQLWAKNTAVTPPSAYIVPSNWLTPVATGVPPGWALLANPAAVQWNHADDQGGQVTLTAASGGTATFTKLSDGTYQAEPGDSDLLKVDGNGHLQLATSDGFLYTFNPDGTLSSMTTIADDRHPTALQYAYTGTPPLLTSITDPVSGRSVTLVYGGNPACPTANQAPGGMLCQVSYWDGTTTSFGYNANRQLTMVTSPGGQVNLFGYDSDNRLAVIQDALASDYLAAGGVPGAPLAFCPQGTTGVPVNPVDTQICYDVNGRVASVTQPAPALGAARPSRTYNYAAGHTDVMIAGFSPASGYAERTVYDAQGRITQQIDSAGHVTTAVWTNAPSSCGACGIDEPLVTVDPAGDQTSTVYDANGNVTDVYGPAPVACFSGAWWPAGTTPTAPVQGYLPVASPQTTTGCGVAVPHTHNGYDEGIPGLAETFWPNGQFAGPAAQHGTGEGGPQTTPFCTPGMLCAQWAAGSPPVSSDGSGHWALRLTGTINLPISGGYGFWITASQPTALYIDGLKVLDDSPIGRPGFVAGQQNTTGFSAGDSGLGYGYGPHQIEVDFQGSATQLNDFTISYEAWWSDTSNFTTTPIPASGLDPNYGLRTSTTDPDGKTTTTSFSNATIGPEYGLPTVTTVGAGSSTPLTTTLTYEAPGPGSYLRKTSSTLPAGNATTYSYYTGTGGPVAAACGVTASTPQGGQVEQQTDPAPGGSGQARVEQFIFDAAGRQAGVRIGTSADIASAPWQCTYRDARGRIQSETWPAANGAPARTVTYAYNVGGNPLVSSVTDAGFTVTSTVDRLDRSVSYTDAWGQDTTDTYNQAGQRTATSTVNQTGQITISTQFGYDPNTGKPATTTVNGNLLATSGYDSSGRLTSVTYANNTEATLGYDAYGRQRSLAFLNPGSGQLITVDGVTKSVAGRVSTETALQPDGSSTTVSYCYDGAGRLTGVAGSAGCSSTLASSYSYAPNAAADQCTAHGGNPGEGANTNRTSVTTPAGNTDYCYNTADQLVASITGGVTDTSYAYNELGDQTNDNGTIYTWDASDRPVTATTPAGTVVTGTYDPVDRLIQSASTATGTATVRYSYSGYGDSLAAILDTSNRVLQQVVGLPGGVSVTLQPSGNVWSYTNLQGNCTATADSTGTRTAGPVSYDPWGNPSQPVPSTVTGPNGLGAYAASGKLTNKATGAVLLGARTFDPAEARFLSVDPVSGGCANAYTYSFGDPLNHADLTGKAACEPMPTPGYHCHGFLDSYCDYTLSPDQTKALNATLQKYQNLGPAAAETIVIAACTAVALTAAVTGVGAAPAIIYDAACTLLGTLAMMWGYDTFAADVNEAASAGGEIQVNFGAWGIPVGQTVYLPCKE
jgi:RHS repeat-associated protein